MKRFPAWVSVAVLGLAFQLHAAESVAIYQLFDMMGLSGYKIMSKEEFQKLSAEVKEEEKVFQSAMTEAKKAWDENKGNKGWQPFPMTKVKPRSVKKFGSDFTSMEQAKKRLAQAESHTTEKQLSSQRQNPTPEDTARDEAKARAFAEAVSMVKKRMGDKLGRPVPAFGFTTPEEPNKKIQ